MSARTSRVRATLRRSWPVLVSYAVFSVWGFGCLVMSVAFTKGGFGTPGDVAAMAGLIAATVAGHVLGNVLGIAGFRMIVVLLAFGVLFAGALAASFVAGPAGVFVIVAAIAALGGYLGVASRLDVVAAWYPLGFCVGGALVWINHHAAVGAWKAGEKYAVWDGFTIACLAGGVFLMLVFLATRNALALTVWQEGAGRRRLAQGDAPPVARPGRGSLLVLFVFTLLVLGVTALVSPYLFRTRAADAGDDTQHSNEHGAKGHEGSKSGSSGAAESTSKEGRDGDEAGEDGSSSGSSSSNPGTPDGEGAAKAAGEALSSGLSILAWLLAATLLLLLLLFVAFPPIRRALLVRHLERPLWPVAPTARVMNLWRRALALLAVVELEPAAGEAPSDFARRAESMLRTTLAADSPGLNEAARMVEKIDYAGRGLGAGDEQQMRAAVEAFVQAIGPRVAWSKKLRAAWGRPPEVEP